MIAISGCAVVLAIVLVRMAADEPAVTEAVRFRVYPNPFQEEIRVRHDSDSGEDLQLELIDLTGRVLRRSEFGASPDGSYVMQVKDLALSQGFYLVRIMQAGEGKVVKVMKR